MEMFTATMPGVFPLTAVIIERLTWDTPVIRPPQQTVFGTCWSRAASLTAASVN